MQTAEQYFYCLVWCPSPVKTTSWTMMKQTMIWKKLCIQKGKGFPYSLLSAGPGAHPGVQAVSPQVTIIHPPGDRLPVLFAMPAVTFPAAEYHRFLTGTQLYCLVTESHRCEQLAQGCYTAFAANRIWIHDLLIASQTLYPLCHLYKFINYMALTETAFTVCPDKSDNIKR